jgi:hypothetical protein
MIHEEDEDRASIGLDAVRPRATPIDPGEVWEEAEPDVPRPSLLGSSWRGAKTALRWVTCIVGLIVGAIMLPGLALMGVGVGSGRGIGVPRYVAYELAMYFGFALWGMILGAVIGLVKGLIGRARRGKAGPSWWAAANRPIRLSRRRRDPATSIESARWKSFRRRWPFLLGVPVQLMMMASFGTGVYLGWQVDTRLAAAKAAADEDDPYWRLDDLLAHRDPVPDEENSALVVAEAMELIPASWPEGPAPTPGVPKPPPNEASQAYGRMNATEDNVRIDDATADAIRDELEKYRETVQIARTVMYYDRGRHEVEFAPTALDPYFSETWATRTLARLLVVDSAIRSHDRDLDGALDSCRAILCTSRSIGDEPFLLSQLLRIVIGEYATRSTRRVLGQGEPSDAALARLQALVLDELGQPLLLHGMRGKRAALIELIRRIRDGEVPISSVSDSLAKIEPVGFGTRATPWGKLMYDNQMAVALEWLNEAVAIARRPTVERPALWQAWEARRKRASWSWYSAFGEGLPRLLTAGLSAESSSHSRHEADLGATAILLAAERHRRRTGAWPASIDDIDEEILPDPPLDPFSDQPFRMEHRDGRLFIHSVGPNGRDEHGAYEPRKWSTGGPDDVGAIGWDVDLRRQPATDDRDSP